MHLLVLYQSYNVSEYFREIHVGCVMSWSEIRISVCYRVCQNVSAVCVYARRLCVWPLNPVCGDLKVLKLSRRQNWMKFSRADSRFRIWSFTTFRQFTPSQSSGCVGGLVAPKLMICTSWRGCVPCKISLKFLVHRNISTAVLHCMRGLELETSLKQNMIKLNCEVTKEV